jgi:hypothetical protein
VGTGVRWSLRLACALALIATTAGCGISTHSGPTPIAAHDVPFQLLNPTTPSTPANPTTPAVGVPELIYLVGPGNHLVAATRDIRVPANLNQILEALFEGPTYAESKSGLQSFVTDTSAQATTTVAGGVATVNFGSDPIQVFGPEQTLAIAQIVFTITEQSTVTGGVLFQIGGVPIEVPTATGALVAGPVTRANYQPQAPLF